MTTKSIDFYFDFGSPTAYLAWTQLPKIAREAGAQLNLRPILLGGIFQATGNRSPADTAAKVAWMQQDMARFSKRYGVSFRNNPFFPINMLLLMRGATGMQLRHPERLDDFVRTVYEAMWVHGLDMSKPEVVSKVFQDAGFDVNAIMALTQDPAVKETLRAATEAAVKRGIFGAPTMFVGDDMYFGQDRLDFVKEALT